jgi:26S proteasome regulatory subunit N4
MSFTLPSPDSPAERARALMARKDAIEAELEAQGSILKANNTDMRQPLVDREGFPRNDLDVWAVRHARVRIIELRNDLTALMDEIAKALETVYPRPTPPPAEGAASGADASSSASAIGTEAMSAEMRPFAKVKGVAPGSPAADAVRPHLTVVISLCILTPPPVRQDLRREDLIVKFGGLRHPQPDLQSLAAVVAENENVRSRLVHGLIKL